MLSRLGLLCRLAGYPVGRLPGWPVTRLAGYPVIPLAGLPVSRFTSSNGPTGQRANGPTGQRANGPNRHGQSTIELAILVALVVTVLVSMSIYLQRGYQGYLRDGGGVHGVQFDPNQPYSGTQRLSSYTRDQTIEMTSAEASVPGIDGTTLPARALTTKVDTVTAWDISRDANYEAK